MLQKKLLTLCMITKNDEEILLDSIENMRDIVDEILIVDIGSTDKTIEIANSAGLDVRQVAWENDFSKIKNYCLDHSNGKWVLFLQANETIPTEQKSEIIKLLDNPNVEGYLFYINYNSQVYSVFSPVQTLRLIRNRKEYRYKYKSFEMIKDELITNIKDVDIHIEHRYDVAFSWEFTSKIKLLYNEIKENPEDCYLQYMFGIFLINQNKFEECIKYLQKAKENLNMGYLFAPHLYKCLSFSLLYLEKYSDCIDVLNDGVEKFPYYRDLFVIRGELYNQLNQYDNSIKDFEHSLKMKERSEYIVPGPDIDISAILESAGDVYEKIFDYQKALKYYQESYELNNTNYDLLYKILSLEEKTNHADTIESMLELSISQKNSEQLLILINFLLSYQKYSVILNNINGIESLLGKREQIQTIKIICQIMLNEEAEDLQISNIESPFYISVLLKRIEKSWVENNLDESLLLLSEMNEIQNIDESVKNLYTAINELFTEKESVYIKLSEQELEILKDIHNNLIWRKQEDKAKLLLYILLNCRDDDCYIELAQTWALHNDLDVINQIFQCVNNADKKEEFKLKIMGTLFINKQSERAQELINLWGVNCLQHFENVKLCKDIIKRLNCWFKEIDNQS